MSLLRPPIDGPISGLGADGQEATRTTRAGHLQGLLRQILHTGNYRRERGQGFPCAVCFALLEIITGLSHGVRDMREAKYPHSGRASKGVKGCSFHLDREDAFGTRCLDGLCGLPKGRVGGPARSYDAMDGTCQRF